MAKLTRQDWLALLLYLGVAVAIGFADYRVRPGPQQDLPFTTYIPGVLDGKVGAPATYRVLTPYLVDSFNRATGLEPRIGFVVTRLLFIYAALAALHAYLRHWYSPGAALGGTLGVAALLPLTFTDGWAHPDAFPELALFTLGCLCVARRSDVLFGIVLAVATLNRETAGFLVLLWALCRLPGRWAWADVGRLAVYAGTWAAIYVGLRWLRGYQSYTLWMLKQNLDMFRPVPPAYDPYRRIFGYFWLILLAVPTWLAARGSRMADTPVFIRRAVPTALAFLVTCFLISNIVEVRIFLPMFPLLLPAVVRVFVAPERNASEA